LEEENNNNNIEKEGMTGKKLMWLCCKEHLFSFPCDNKGIVVLWSIGH